MRRALLVLALLAPITAAGPSWSVDVTAPEVVEAGQPFVARVCVAQVSELRVVLMLGGEAVSRNGSRYGPPGEGCRDVTVRSDDVTGDATLLVRARAPGGASQAEARVPIRMARSNVSVHLVEAWGAPFAGAVLRNDGWVSVSNLTLGGVALPPIPSGAWFVGPRSPPGALAQVATAAPHDWTLRMGARVVASLPAPKPGEVTSVAGASRMGVSNFSAERLLVNGSWTAFVTPDAGDAPLVGLIDSARDEVLVEAYTITSTDVASALARALERGVSVRALLEGAPVGGVPSEEKPLVAALVARGASVSFLRSAPDFPTRYATLHAKLVVVDRERVLVSTENLHASSYPPLAGAAGTRGFGLVVGNASLARQFASVMDADAAPWPDVQAADLASLPPPAELTTAAVRRAGPTLSLVGAEFNATMVLSPENSARDVEALLRRASERIDVAMLFADAQANPMLDALVAAARRNVTVRLLLDAHVDDGRNAADVARLNALAAREGLSLMTRLADANHTLHAKLVLVDGHEAYVGSMNWGRASMRNNREAGLIIEAPPLVEFYERSFQRDWTRPQEAVAEVSSPVLRALAAPQWVPLVATAFAAALTCRASCRK
ncbi:MAG: phospholipase D-like domain-containing protein [Candidatus Thermoplasmatota archaeon]